MIHWLRDFRLLPIALIAIGCLFALKTLGLILDGGYTLGQRLGGGGTMVVTTVPVPAATQLQSPTSQLEGVSGTAAGPKPGWMKEMFYPDVTGSVAAKPKEAPKEPANKEAAGGKPPITPESKAAAGTAIPLNQPRAVSAGERALLERLQERRQELEKRARELDMREGMLKAAEKKAESQAAAEKADVAKGGSAAQRKEDADNSRFKGVVTMYETMKPKDAAKIFDRLDMKVLLEVASAINPRRMSEILAQMTPEAAERLTVELAARGPTDRAVNPASLPKIDGRPSGG